MYIYMYIYRELYRYDGNGSCLVTKKTKHCVPSRVWPFSV